MSQLFEAARWPFGIAVGTAVGGAVAGGITPAVQGLINEANSNYPLKPPSYFMLAEGVAKGRVDPGWAADRAAEQGISGDAFSRLSRIAQIGPGVDVAFELWRRNLIPDSDFARAIAEEGIDAGWLAPLEGLKQRLLSPAELANARQQMFIDDGRLHSEGALQGYDAERMDLLFLMAGLPPGPMEGLEMLRRGIISESEFRQLVAEGHTKTKYTDALLGLERRILSAPEWAGLWLRGWATQAEAEAGGALEGFDAAAMENLYKNRGRPATVRQAHIGFARGGRLAEAGNDERETILRAVQESDIRTEWFDILWSQRYTYPSAFVIRALAQDGTFSEAQTEEILLESGWRPDLAAQAAQKWGAQVGGATATWLNRAKTRLFTTAHNEYMAGRIDATQAHSLLTRLGAAPAEADSVLAIWDVEAPIQTRDLTQAQIIKLWKKGELTDAQALERLEYHGLSTDDATKLLAANG